MKKKKEDIAQDIVPIKEELGISGKYGIEHPKKKAFLAAYAECGTVTRAAEIAEIERGTHYNWLKDDPIYAKACDDAYEQAGERLEQEARRRAVEGVKKTVFYQGEPCGVNTEYSDTLLIFLLKGAKPEKYQERVRNEVVARTEANGEQVNTLKQLKDMEDNREE